MKVVVATGNMGKLKEFQRILAPYGVEVLSQKEAGADIEVEETGTTFEENAYLKAAAVFAATGIPAIADDSGLVVDALDGAPGVYTARYAGEDATDDENIQKLLSNMEGVKKRSARFVSAICYVWDQGKSLTTRGECEGTVGFEKRVLAMTLFLWWGKEALRSFPPRKKMISATEDGPSASLWRNLPS